MLSTPCDGLRVLPLLSLPAEILVVVLRNLDYKSLLRCTSVCRQLRKTIAEFVELQYIIELAADGMEDNATCGLSHQDRLSALLSRRERLTDLRWKYFDQVKLTGTCLAYELVGGVFAKISGNGTSPQTFTAVWLPTSTGEGQRRIFKNDIGPNIRDFAMDPTQDLLVIFKEADGLLRHRSITLHVLMLSEDKPHPRANQRVLEGSRIMHPIQSAFMQIADDLVGLFAWVNHHKLLVWNWRTGILLVDSCLADLVPAVWDFSFISNRACIICDSSDSGAIHVFAFSDTPLPRRVTVSYGGSEATSRLVHIAKFELPPLRHGAAISSISSHIGPAVSGFPSRSIFASSEESKLLVLSLEYSGVSSMNGNAELDWREGPTRYAMFLKSETFLEYVRKYFNESPEVGGDSWPVLVSWREWGLKKTRFMPMSMTWDWLRYVQGNRVVIPNAPHSPIETYDFNVGIGRNNFANANDLPTYDPAEFDPEVVEITTVHNDHFFDTHVETSLPYRISSRNIPGPYSGFFIDDERIVGVRASYGFAFTDDGDMNKLDVFVF